MIPFDVTTLLIGLTVLIIGIWYFGSKRQNLPPGPTPWPLVGNLISIGRAKSLTEALYEYQKQYGNIFTLYFGSHPTVILCGQKMIREALVSNADYFSTRPDFMTVFKAVYKNKGIIWDPNWKANRKSALVTMKDFGLGKHSLEDRVREEARSLCERLERMEGETTDIHPWLSKAFSNIVCTIVFGQRFEYDDPKFTNMMDLMDSAFADTGSTSVIIDYIPQLLIIPKIKAQFNKLLTINRNLETYIKESIEEHKKSFDRENLRDFIDLYLNSEEGNEDTAMSTIKELFLAGTETTGTTLSWALLILAKYPDIQKKCQQEIKEVIGTSRGPVNADRGTVPFTEATLMEVQRFVTVAPVALPHAVSDDTTFAGYHLKKDTLVFPFLDSSHQDPDVWPDHDKFRPERWLDASGKFDPRSPGFMPFSVGRRACLGEQLAKMELFIVFISLLQQFEFLPMPGKSVSLEGRLGISYSPADSRIVFRRKDL